MNPTLAASDFLIGRVQRHGSLSEARSDSRGSLPTSMLFPSPRLGPFRLRPCCLSPFTPFLSGLAQRQCGVQSPQVVYRRQFCEEPSLSLTKKEAHRSGRTRFSHLASCCRGSSGSWRRPVASDMQDWGIPAHRIAPLLGL